MADKAPGATPPVDVAAKNPTELCATLYKSLKGGGRCIALVVRAENHNDAETFADEQIQTIVADINAKAKALEAKKPDTAVTVLPVDTTLVPDGNALQEDEEEDDGEVEEGPKVQWNPTEMIKEYKAKNTPLGGGAEHHTTTRAVRFVKNFTALTKLGTKTTWLVLDPKKKQAGLNANETHSYFNDSVKKPNKTVVVVRSEVFWLPSNDDADLAPKEYDGPIFVCSIPASSINTNTSYMNDASKRHYADAFSQISTFVTTYNQEENQDKINLVAIAYPMDLYALRETNAAAADAKAAKTKAAAAKKPAPKKQATASAKVNPTPKAKANAQPIAEDAGHDSDEVFDGYIDLSVEEDAATDEKDAARHAEMSFFWLKAVEEFVSRHSSITVRLMHGTKNGYKAPPLVIDHFNNTNSVIGVFPDCVDQENEHEEGPSIGMAKVKKTLFVCDRVAGKRVGNDNDDTTCGGTFGMWVPMHFTSSRIDEKKYANAAEFNQLISVIESK